LAGMTNCDTASFEKQKIRELFAIYPVARYTVPSSCNLYVTI
jgi:hypothetical protein